MPSGRLARAVASHVSVRAVAYNADTETAGRADRSALGGMIRPRDRGAIEPSFRPAPCAKLMPTLQILSADGTCANFNQISDGHFPVISGWSDACWCCWPAARRGRGTRRCCRRTPRPAPARHLRTHRHQRHPRRRRRSHRSCHTRHRRRSHRACQPSHRQSHRQTTATTTAATTTTTRLRRPRARRRRSTVTPLSTEYLMRLTVRARWLTAPAPRPR